MVIMLIKTKNWKNNDNITHYHNMDDNNKIDNNDEIWEEINRKKSQHKNSNFISYFSAQEQNISALRVAFLKA